MLEPGLPDLADPRAGQHAEPDDIGTAPVLGRVQRGGKFSDFLLRQKPFARILDPAAKARGRIVLPPAPALRIGEHLSQHLADAVGAHRCWL